MVTQEAVIEALQEVYDPEIPISVVDLGLIYGVEVDGDQVKIKMTMTMPGCPMHSFMTAEAKNKVEALEGVKEARVELVWDPPWTPARISPEIKKRLGFA